MNIEIPQSTLNRLFAAFGNGNRTLRRATCFVDPKTTAKLTRQQPPKGKVRSATFLLTVGNPNFVERGLIATMVKAGEPFPVKKLKLQEYPAKKAKVAKK